MLNLCKQHLRCPAPQVVSGPASVLLGRWGLGAGARSQHSEGPGVLTFCSGTHLCTRQRPQLE